MRVQDMERERLYREGDTTEREKGIEREVAKEATNTALTKKLVIR